jgi:cell division protein FtsW
MTEAQKMAKADRWMLMISLILMGLGIVFVYSSSFVIAQERFGGADYFLGRHVIRGLLALACFIVFMNIDYHNVSKLSTILFVVSVILLLGVLVMPGQISVNGAKRWISLGFVRFQVSDLARIALILRLAVKLEYFKERIKERAVFIQLILNIGLICFLVMLEPNFSTAALTGCIGVSMLFIAGARISHILGLVSLILPVAGVVLFMAPYRVHRIMSFLHDTGSQKSYQSYQALVGLGNGGGFGVGLGQGEQKYLFLPEPHTDFVYSILGEEIGFAGLMVVFALFGVLLYRGMKIALCASDKMGQVMAFGLTFFIGLYLILHVAVNTALIPTTGIPLPFISYGGMSLIFTMSSMGILLNISSQARGMNFSAKRQIYR